MDPPLSSAASHGRARGRWRRDHIAEAEPRRLRVNGMTFEPGPCSPMYPEDASVRGDIADVVTKSDDNLRLDMSGLVPMRFSTAWGET